MALARRPRRWAVRLAVLLSLLPGAAGCGGLLDREYEYDEQIDLALDGSAIVYVSASVPALVALRGFELDIDPRARFDRDRIRALYEGDGVRVTQVSSFRRHGRRFAHVRLEVDDVRRLSNLAPFSWSRYRLNRADDEYRFLQDVEAPMRRQVSNVGWTGAEWVSFRIHFPSRVRFHNAGEDNLKRGNILVWEQPLAERLAGRALVMEARMDSQSILYRTLWLFGGTFLAALAALGMAVWWIGRKGRSMVPA